MADLYDDDILAWSVQQADLLRRVAAGERVGGNSVDWANVIEEIESVGRSDLHAVESLLTQAILHLLKAQAWPDSSAVPGWRAEAALFRRQAARRFTPSMRQKLDVATLYADAVAGVPETIDGQPPLPFPTECGLTLDDLLTPR
jgi:hypothetical protein